MPTFTAKETSPAAGVVGKVEELPSADHDSLRHLGASENFPRHWQYIAKKHTLDDLIRPNYFGRGDTRDNLRLGDEIHFTACGGSNDPETWQRGILCVIEKPNVKEKPVVIGILHRYAKVTPCRDVGEKVKAA